MADDHFFHEGIYVGDGKVVHVINQKFRGIRVVKDTLEKFARNKVVKVKNIRTSYSPQEIVARAESMVGKRWKYDRFLNNCENFTNDVVIGKSHSYQSYISLELAMTGALAFYARHRNISGLIAGLLKGIMASRAMNKILYEQ